MKFLLSLIPLSFFAPLFALAQSGAGNLQTVTNFLNNIRNFMNGTLVPLIFALAFLVFLWGMFKTFILGGGDEEGQKKGKQLMMYAIAGFVIMVSLWGIVNLVANGFGLKSKTIDGIPDLPTSR